MLRIVKGGFYSTAYDIVKKEICELVELRKKVFLIVPEQQAIIAEKEFSDLLPESASITFEVTNFTRLANTVERRLGGLAGEYADSGKEALVMWMTLAELAPILNMTGGHGEINAGLVSKALRAVEEMRGLSATPEELATLAEKDGIKKTKRLSDKLSDISKIMTLYNTLLTQRYTSVRDECDRLAVKLTENPEVISDAAFYVTGFTSFTEPQYKVLSAIMKAAELTVHLTLPQKSLCGFEFKEIEKTETHLSRVANAANVRTALVKQNELRESTDSLLECVCSNLWKHQAKIDNKYLQNINDKIRIFEASDPYEECDFIAGDIKRRVMDGDMWRDFAIVARDNKNYVGIIDSALMSAGIPHFISKRKSISSYEAIKLIYSAFAVYDSSFARENIISYSKCRLCGVSAEACDEFELYTEKWQIDGNGFTNGIFWNMDPEGYTARKDEKKESTLLRINETREAIIQPLVKFCDSLKSATTVREHATALVNFLVDISLEQKLLLRSAFLRSYGELEAAEENERLWDIICAALDSTVEVTGDTKCTAVVFLEQLKVILSEVDVGKIPAFYDEVTVGSADMIRLSEKKHIYLIGVNAGEFPAPASQSSYFTERDKAALAEAGLSDSPDNEVLYARELFFFSRAFSSAKESVTLLYSLRGADLTQSAKSDVIAAISDMTGGALKPRKISDIPPLERVYSPAPAMDIMNIPAVNAALCEAGYAREIQIASKDISATATKLDRETVEVMYPSDIALTQTRIDTFVGCPLSYYLRFSLKLSDNEKAQFDARNIGSFIHAILENFFTELRERGEAIGEIEDKTRTEMVNRAAKKYLREISGEYNTPTKRTEILLDRLSRSAMPIIDGLCDEMRDCSFIPRFFELRIGKEDENLPRPATFKDKDGKSIFVYGSIDRVDTFKCGDDVYVRVIDYKTGHKTFSPSDIDEGKNLQMFLYLKAIVETENQKFRENIGVTGDGRILPGGVIYVKTDMSDVTVPHADEEAAKAAIKKKQERRGMLLDDKLSLDAMNKDFIPVKFKANGEPDSRYQKYLYSYDEWRELDGKISEKVCEVAEKIKSGDISTTNQKHNPPCDFCQFKPICRKNIT